ncbi:MAG: hypothetical protein MUP81_04510 [Dehalococcoidia bacterium]|nr:hypothetical protein [Dehalococcoidia bacterium]
MRKQQAEKEYEQVMIRARETQRRAIDIAWESLNEVQRQALEVLHLTQALAKQKGEGPKT